MSIGPLPRQTDIRKLVSLGAVLEGSVKVSTLDRITQVLAEDSGVVEYSLHFGVTEDGYAIVEGQIKATVVVLCQRCLRPMDCALASEFLLGVVPNDEKARLLPKRLEPLVLADEMVDPAAILEEELLLCLPIVSYHPQDQCARAASYQTEDVGAELAKAPGNNPFDVLAVLKKPES